MIKKELEIVLVITVEEKLFDKLVDGFEVDILTDGFYDESYSFVIDFDNELLKDINLVAKEEMFNKEELDYYKVNVPDKVIVRINNKGEKND